MDDDYDPVIYKNALQACMKDLCENFQVDYAYPHFRSKFLITLTDQERIQAERTRAERTRTLLDILLIKDPKQSYGVLYDYILETCYQHYLARILRHELDRQKQLCPESCPTNNSPAINTVNPPATNSFSTFTSVTTTTTTPITLSDTPPNSTNSGIFISTPDDVVFTNTMVQNMDEREGSSDSFSTLFASDDAFSTIN